MTKQNLSIHTKKFYRVVLLAIDPEQETMESFAIKLSMRLKVAFPRVRQVVQNLPYTVKSHLSASQANKLKSMIEEVGGRIRLETHFATPGDKKMADPRGDSRDHDPAPEGAAAEMNQCPSCGWESAEDVSFCSMCHRRFRKKRSGLGSRIPHDNPLEKQSFRPTDPVVEETPPHFDPAALWARYRLPIIIGAAGVLLLLLIFFK